jgi:hypothetical protein
VLLLALFVPQVRGPAIAAWAQHLQAVWLTKSYKDGVHFSKANLQVYGSITGVPDVILGAADSPQSEEEAAELQSLLSSDQQGYASTRVGSAEEAAAAEDGGSSAAEAGSAQAGYFLRNHKGNHKSNLHTQARKPQVQSESAKKPT